MVEEGKIIGSQPQLFVRAGLLYGLTVHPSVHGNPVRRAINTPNNMNMREAHWPSTPPPFELLLISRSALIFLSEKETATRPRIKVKLI